MEETDRRIRRTRKLLKKAIVEVTLEKGYEHVTIQDITDRADIGYRTYFRHYSSIDELLADAVHEKLEELRRMIGFAPGEEGESAINMTRPEKAEIIFRFIRDNQDIFRIIFLQHGARFCLEPLYADAQRRAGAAVSQIAGDRISAEIMSNHVVASTLALMRWWLVNDMPYPPARMGEIFVELVVLPSMAAAGASVDRSFPIKW